VCQGYPTDSEVEFLGLPQGFVPLMLHNWQGARLETLHDGLCKLLRTTRAKTLEERKAQWLKQHGGSRVPFAKARALAQAIPPTTIFSFLWRLRHRVDYRDIDDLIPGPDRPHHAVEFHDALATVTSATIALFEGLIERTAGREVIVDSITPFAKKHRKHAARLRRRWPLEGITE